MSTNFLHGAESVEVEKGPRPVRVVKTAVIGLIGTALAGAVNTPTLVLSDKQGAQFGAEGGGSTIPSALNAIFKQGSGTVIVINVLDPAVHKTAVNQLNEAGILTVFSSFGTGFRTWGNRSAAWPSITHPRNFINVRRTADVLHESLEYAMLQFIDQPITPALIDAIVESVNAFIRTLIGRGALIDGKCTYDPAKNPTTEVALGHLTFGIEFMVPTPGERFTFESFINIELLKQLAATE